MNSLPDEFRNASFGVSFKTGLKPVYYELALPRPFIMSATNPYLEPHSTQDLPPFYTYLHRGRAAPVPRTFIEADPELLELMMTDGDSSEKKD